MVSTPHVSDNMKHALTLLKQAANEGAQLAVLPEYFCAMSFSENDKFTFAENYLDALNAPIQNALSQAAKELNLWVVAGSLPLKVQDHPHHVYNTCLVYNPQGESVVRYDKIHLFKFYTENDAYDESRTHAAGTSPQTFMLHTNQEENYKCGLSLCYDLRFPELYRKLSAPNTRPCDILFVPAAFTHTTGKAHWEILLRARAIENQCYVIAAAQAGQHENSRHTWGHSMIIDPWGEILTVKDAGEHIIYANISPNRIHEVRTQLPALSNRMLTD